MPMITKCDNKTKERVLNYIGHDYGKCLYIYIDIIEFGMSSDYFNVWIQEDNNNICAVISEYYGGFQLYSKDLNCNPEELTAFLKDQSVNLIFGIDDVISLIRPYYPDFETESGIVGEIKDIKVPVDDNAYSADEKELKEIVSLVAEDPAIGKPYGYESLYKQYLERKQTGFGRNFILRDPTTNEIICHAGTYAELSELAVIGGVITNPKYRGKGYSKGTLATLCSELKKESKNVFSFFYIPSAKAMHYGVGFEKIGTWTKLYRTKGEE